MLPANTGRVRSRESVCAPVHSRRPPQEVEGVHRGPRQQRGVARGARRGAVREAGGRHRRLGLARQPAGLGANTGR